ncbi:MAG: tRNA (adenosine(37)-N6)-threonylcarbamoyltransferase complex transferase subunit TsaD [Patescibacteria group bacterium]
MIILGIETSCDETAAAVVNGLGNNVKVLSNVVSSQIEIHQKYGGVVPEVAAREHVLSILPVVNEALAKAKMRTHVDKKFAHVRRIDAIAVTVGPGLVTSLMVGVETAKALAFGWQVPVVGVNHIKGHIYANFISANSKYKIQNSKQIQKPKFPALILTVSGGHTMLVLMNGHGKYKVIGETLDDAAGEAFDKAAAMLGIGYPGGPAVADEAAKLKVQSSKLKVKLPRPMLNDKNFNFSFSGLKTALLYAIQRDKKWKEKISEYCAEFQQAVVDVLITKTIKAAKMLNCQTIMLSGGVASNKELRSQLNLAIKTKLTNAKLIIPKFKYCVDNAAMVATAGYFKAIKKGFTTWQKLKTHAN